MPFARENKLAKGGRRTGSGRKKLSVRHLCAAEFEKRIPILCSLADDEKNRPQERIAAIKELARVGIPEKHEHTGPDGESLGKTTVTISIDFERYAREFDEFAVKQLGERTLSPDRN